MIYISYGVTKSASTYVYQLTEEVFRCSGRPPVKLPIEVKNGPSWENYIDPVTIQRIVKVREVIQGRDTVIKTHSAPDDDILSLVSEGELYASAIFRDPREIALALVDHGARSRASGIQDFAEFIHPLQTIGTIKLQIARLMRWRLSSKTLFLSYNDVCFNTTEVVKRIAEQIGVSVDPEKVMGTFKDKSKIGQFNVGMKDRYNQMSAHEQDVFLRQFADFYRMFFPDEVQS